MAHKIMVLFDSVSIRSEAIQYSVELAKRMKSALVLLVILPLEVSENSSDGIELMLKQGTRAKAALKVYRETIQDAGITVESAVRIGSPPSELVKFLAESGGFQTIVWGGQPDLLKKPIHWLAHMQDIIKRAVVVPYIKDKSKNVNRRLKRWT